jgi:hypothetical protein
MSNSGMRIIQNDSHFDSNINLDNSQLNLLDNNFDQDEYDDEDSVFNQNF